MWPPNLNNAIGLRATIAILAATLAVQSAVADIAKSTGGCGGAAVACKVSGSPGGQYYVATPPNWDGKRRLGVMMFFHGFNASGRAFITSKSVLAAAARGNYLLITPDGLNKTWAFRGSPSTARDEVAYVSAILEDAGRRFPIDKTDTWAAGFSMGGSMTTDLACRMGNRFNAFVAIAGTFWNPLPSDCATGPVNLLHIHGKADNVVPLSGRKIGSWQQGNVNEAFGVLRQVAQCSAKSVPSQPSPRYSCQQWSSCATGRQLELCLHDGGHKVPEGWADLAYAFLARVGAQPSTPQAMSKGQR